MAQKKVNGWLKATDQKGFYTFEVFEYLQQHLRAILRNVKPTTEGEYMVSLWVVE